MGKVLVTGGAGYIGSHIVRMLVEHKQDVIVLDDLSAGHHAAIGDVPLVEADFGDASVLDPLLAEARIDEIIHMAAFCEVGQSVTDPAIYYSNNVLKSLTLLEAARRHGVRSFVFSSSAAVYGEPEALPLSEDHPKRPTNPYGETKWIFERALDAYHHAYGTRYIALRYFNAAGAHPDGSIGEDHADESHLIPRLLRALRPGASPIPIMGEDYPTPDGTCIRDYIHVLDLARAHLQALELLRSREVGAAINLGNGAGYSVREVIDTVERVTGSRPPTLSAPRRAGDPARLTASALRAQKLLDWSPAFVSLEEIVQSAWNWHQTHPEGYEAR